eukprot:scaffold11634_cov109-Cylindrotheca_fusiformis.AAC.5
MALGGNGRDYRLCFVPGSDESIGRPYLYAEGARLSSDTRNGLDSAKHTSLPTIATIYMNQVRKTILALAAPNSKHLFFVVLNSRN